MKTTETEKDKDRSRERERQKKNRQETKRALVCASVAAVHRVLRSGLLTFVGNGNLDGSVLQGVWMAVSGGGHD